MKKNRLSSEKRNAIKDIFDYIANINRPTPIHEIAMEKVDMLLFGYWGGKFYDKLRFIIKTSYPYRLITENELYVIIDSKIYFALEDLDEKLSANPWYWKLKSYKDDLVNAIIKFLKTIVFIILVLLLIRLMNEFSIIDWLLRR